MGKDEYDIARYLIEKGADVNAEIQNRLHNKSITQNIFCLALQAGQQKPNVDFLKYLISKGANPHKTVQIDRRKFANSAYVWVKDVETALYLMTLNVKPRKYNQKIYIPKSGKTRLSAGSDERDLDSILSMVDAYIRGGVKPNNISLHQINSVNYAIVEYLCSKGADFAEIASSAAIYCNFENLKYLIENGLHVDSLIEDYWGSKKSLLAIHIGNSDIKNCEYLIANGADLYNEGVESAVLNVFKLYKRYKNSTVQWQKNEAAKYKEKLAVFAKKHFTFSENFKNAKSKTMSQQDIDLIRQCGLIW